MYKPHYGNQNFTYLIKIAPLRTPLPKLVTYAFEPGTYLKIQECNMQSEDYTQHIQFLFPNVFLSQFLQLSGLHFCNELLRHYVESNIHPISTK